MYVSMYACMHACMYRIIHVVVLCLQNDTLASPASRLSTLLGLRKASFILLTPLTFEVLECTDTTDASEGTVSFRFKSLGRQSAGAIPAWSGDAVTYDLL